MPDRSTIQQLFDRLADDLTRDEFDGAAMRVSYPAAIYRGEELVPVPDAGTFRVFLDQVRAAHLGAGIVRQTAIVRAESIRLGRLRSFWVEWQHFDGAGNRVSSAFVRYFCDLTPEGVPVIKLFEILDSDGDPGPEVLPWMTLFAGSSGGKPPASKSRAGKPGRN